MAGLKRNLVKISKEHNPQLLGLRSASVAVDDLEPRLSDPQECPQLLSCDLLSGDASTTSLEYEGYSKGNGLQSLLEHQLQMEQRLKTLERELKQKEKKLVKKMREVDEERKKVERIERELEVAEVSIPRRYVCFLSVLLLTLSQDKIGEALRTLEHTRRSARLKIEQKRTQVTELRQQLEELRKEKEQSNALLRAHVVSADVLPPSSISMNSQTRPSQMVCCEVLVIRVLLIISGGKDEGNGV